jgi:hypothetical protein
MKYIATILLSFLIQTSEVEAQCQSPITISKLITLKTDFAMAEDLLLECYWKSKVDTMKYSNGKKGRYWAWFSNTRVEQASVQFQKIPLDFTNIIKI